MQEIERQEFLACNQCNWVHRYCIFASSFKPKPCERHEVAFEYITSLFPFCSNELTLEEQEWILQQTILCFNFSFRVASSVYTFYFTVVLGVKYG